MKLKIVTATAIGLVLAGQALAADNNLLFIDQTGLTNTASVTQTGNNNNAGASVAQRRIQQNGTANSLLVQQGNNSNAGLGGSYDQLNQGIDQTGYNNALTINQVTGSVRSVQQSALAAVATGAETNIATIAQSGASNSGPLVTRVQQTYNGAGAVGSANKVTINQTGGAFQVNTVGLKNSEFRYDYATYFTTALTGDQPGSHQLFGGVVQSGNTNAASITQNGANHQVGSVLQLGNGNSFTSSQSGGNGNVITLAHSVGNTNSVNVLQTGASNGVARIDQAGDTNSATVTQVGASNQVGYIDQNGNSNSATLSFTGSGNGSTGFGATFNDRGLTQGNVTQGVDSLSTGNTVTYTVNGNTNQFAFAQLGSSNTITGTVSGPSNQVAVLQGGNTNTTNFTQTGGGSNSLSVSQ